MFDLDHPFYRPLWLRIAIVLFCLGWAAFEFIGGEPLWGAVFGGLGLYAGWRFFVTFAPRPDPKGD